MIAKKLQIFISSPGDVADERRRAALVIKRLNREFARFFDLQAVLWEREAMRASGHFQDVIVPPSATDIVVVILCARLGVPLPERTAVRQYCRVDGRSPVTGTEWEFEDALRANRECGVPELLVYRKPAAAAAVTIQADRLDEAKAQLLALEAFWRRHFIDDRGGFKAAFNQFETLDAFEEQLEQHLRQLLRARLPSRSEPADTEIAWHQGSPFRGLQVFETAHEEIFYGRDRAARAVIEAVVWQASIGTAFVLVLGASGSGKSSLVRAGVVPKLMAPGVVTGVEMWRSCVFKPSEATGDLVAALAQALIGQSNALPELPATGIDLADVITQLRASAVLPLKLGLRQAALAMPRPAGAPVPEARLVLVIDQLEELFTLGEITAEQRANFVALMAALAKSGVVWVLATMRSDLYHRCAELPELVDLAAGEGQYHLTPPRPAELDQMIRLPAAAAGIDFEIHRETGIALNAALLEAAGRDPAALPLLEFTLDELYRQDIEARHGSRLTYESYTALDGLEGAIAARADAACRGLPPSQAAALPGLLSALVTVGEDSDLATARVVPRADLATTPVRTALLDILVRERLLVADDDRTGPVVRLTHEALLSHWPLLKALVDRDRDFLRVRARLQADRARWQAEDHSQDLLLPAGKRLEEAKEVLKARRDEIDAATAGFIEGSIERDRQLRQRSLRRTRALAAVMTALAVIASGFGWYSYDRSIATEAARHQAERNFNTAINAADTLGTQVAKRLRPLAGVKGVSAETVRQILTDAEEILGKLTAEAQNLPLKDRQAVQDRQAKMLMEFGKTYADLGNTDKQLERATEANRIMKGLGAQDSGNLPWQHDLAASHLEVGKVLQAHGELAAALDNYRVCQSLMERLSTQAPDNQEWQRLLATCYTQVGGILSEWGDLPNALTAWRSSEHILERLAALDPNNARVQFQLASVKLLVSDGFRKQDNLSYADESARSYQDIIGNLVAKDPGNSEWQIALANGHRVTGILSWKRDDLSGSLAAFRDGLRIIETLCSQDPSNQQWKKERATIQSLIGGIHLERGDLDDALEAYEASKTTMKSLVDNNCDNSDWQKNLAESHTQVADILRVRHEFDKAIAEYRDAQEIMQLLIKKDPNVIWWQRDLTSIQYNIGDALQGKGDVYGAVDAYRNAQGISASLIAKNPGDSLDVQRLWFSHLVNSGLLQDQGDLAGALEAARSSQAIAERLVTQEPTNTEWQARLANSHETVGNRLKAQGDLAGALTAYRAAVAIREHLTTQEPTNTEWQADLADDHKNIGDLLNAQSDTAGALAAYRAAVAIREHLTTQEPSNTEWQARLANSHETVSNTLKAQGDLVGALAAARSSQAIAERLVTQEPTNTEWQARLASNHKVIGDLLQSQGDTAGAKTAYRSAQAILERLIAQEANTANQQSIAASRHATGSELQTQANMADALASHRLFKHAMHSVGLGEVLRAQGDLDSALAAYRTAGPLLERLVARNPGNPFWQSSLMRAHRDIGNVLSIKGKTAEAVEAYRAAVAAGEHLVAQAPDNPTRKAELGALLVTLSGHYLLTRQFADAKAAAEKGYSLDDNNLELLINMAHAEMFLGHSQAARELHVQHLNDVVHANGNKRWKDVVADDFMFLKKAGLKSSNMLIIEQLLTQGKQK